VHTKTRVGHEVKRNERIEQLKQYFLAVHCEDPVDGTTFDCDVLDALKSLEAKYTDQPTDIHIRGVRVQIV
jgi:hypothetical protein